MKITAVEISGFKGINELVVHPRKINLIVGKNNTGKTSILQAIYWALEKNMFKIQASAYNSHISSFINVNMKESRVVIKSAEENRYFVLSKPELKEILGEFKKDLIERLKESVPHVNKNAWEKAEEMLDKILVKNEVFSEIERESISIETGKEKANLFSYTPQILEHIEPFLDYIDKDISRTGHGFVKFVITRPSFSHIRANEKEEKISAMINNLLVTERTKMSLNKSKINEIQKYLQRRKIVENLERFDFDMLLFKENGKEYEIPYSFMGDGFKALIGLIARTSLASKIILIEEPETHMHPAYIAEVIRQIIDFSIVNNAQFFITTHSSDVLDIVTSDRLEPAYQDYLTKELNIIRVDRLDDSIVSQELDRKMATAELEDLKLDLRGL